MIKTNPNHALKNPDGYFFIYHSKTTTHIIISATTANLPPPQNADVSQNNAEVNTFIHQNMMKTGNGKARIYTNQVYS